MTEAEGNETMYTHSINALDQRRKHRRGRLHRRTAKARKDDRLLQIVTRYYMPHAGYVDWGFDGRTLLHSGKYIKYQKNSNCQRWMKRLTSKRSRRHIDFFGKGNQYRRLFDYWGTLY